MPALYYIDDIPIPANCEFESVLLPEALQAFFFADSWYTVISRDPNIQMRNDSGIGFSVSTLSCQACLVRPSCRSTLSFNQELSELVPKIIFRMSNPEP